MVRKTRQKRQKRKKTRNNPSSNCLNHRLTPDIVTAILVRIPAIYLYQFKLVCKTWLRIIEDTHFVTMHITKTVQTQREPQFIIVCNDNHGIYFIEDADEVVKFRKFDELPNMFEKIWLVGSANGVLCFSNNNGDVVPSNGDLGYVCNPVTKRCFHLPKIEYSRCDGDWVEIATGFGFVQSTNEFKVVKLFYWEVMDDEESWVIESEVQVYTIGSSSWRIIDKTPYLQTICKKGEFYRESLHWVNNGNEYGEALYIVSFNLRSEEFGVVPIPESSSSARVEFAPLHVAVLKGCLSVVDTYGDSIDMWIMKEYNIKESWTKLFSVKKFSINGKTIKGNGSTMQPIAVQKNGDIILRGDEEYLLCYSPRTEECNALELKWMCQNDGYLHNNCTYEACPYSSSIVSPKSACKIEDSRVRDISDIADDFQECI